MTAWLDEALILSPTALTPDVLSRAVPACLDPEGWAEPLAHHLGLAGIDDDCNTALFLAQVGHESASFRELEESLNYSVESLHALFGAHRISRLDIEMLGRKKGQAANEPALANTLYGGEWGARNLGNVQPGDGWKFRGRGLIQLTGRANYEACEAATGLPLSDEPQLLAEDRDAAVEAAMWYWQARVTARDVKGSTYQINGGSHGLADRRERYERALRALEA